MGSVVFFQLAVRVPSLVGSAAAAVVLMRVEAVDEDETVRLEV